LIPIERVKVHGDARAQRRNIGIWFYAIIRA
jgi:hypothetical protein